MGINSNNMKYKINVPRREWVNSYWILEQKYGHPSVLYSSSSSLPDSTDRLWYIKNTFNYDGSVTVYFDIPEYAFFEWMLLA